MSKRVFAYLIGGLMALPFAAHADANDLWNRGVDLEHRGETGASDLQKRGSRLKTEAVDDEGKAVVIEKKTVTTYKKGRSYVSKKETRKTK